MAQHTQAWPFLTDSLLNTPKIAQCKVQLLLPGLYGHLVQGSGPPPLNLAEEPEARKEEAVDSSPVIPANAEKDWNPDLPVSTAHAPNLWEVICGRLQRILKGMHIIFCANSQELLIHFGHVQLLADYLFKWS